MQDHATLIKFVCRQSPPPPLLQSSCLVLPPPPPSSSIILTPFPPPPPSSSSLLFPPHQIHIHHFGHETKASSNLDGIYIWHVCLQGDIHVCHGMQYFLIDFFTSGPHLKMWRYAYRCYSNHGYYPSTVQYSIYTIYIEGLCVHACTLNCIIRISATAFTKGGTRIHMSSLQVSKLTKISYLCMYSCPTRLDSIMTMPLNWCVCIQCFRGWGHLKWIMKWTVKRIWEAQSPETHFSCEVKLPKLHSLLSNSLVHASDIGYVMI